MKIKICGISRISDLPVLNKVHPDFVGFVFAPSKRQVSLLTATRLRSGLEASIPTVGVFVEEDAAFIKEAIDEHIISYVQLHGRYDEEKIKTIKSYGVPVIQALPYTEKEVKTAADYLLFDNLKPGSGEAYDYTQVSAKKPFFLAGGINISNIEDALKTNAYCIDVSSGVETEGIKDAIKIEEIVRRVRQ